MNKPVIIITTVSNKDIGRMIAKALVEDHLAACVSIVGDVNSIYGWEGKICDDNEFILVIKTLAELRDNVFQRIRELHTYEVPELLMIDVADIGEDYFKWMKSWLLFDKEKEE